MDQRPSTTEPNGGVAFHGRGMVARGKNSVSEVRS